MSYRYDISQNPSENFQRIALGRIEQARAKLREDRDVHEARKSLKKGRSFLRLMRCSIDDYRMLNNRLRAAAHRLEEIRDAESMIEVCSDLQEDYSDQLKVGVLDPVQQVFENRRDRALADKGLDTATTDALEILDQAEAEVKATSVDDDPSRVLDGIEKYYKRGRKAMETALEKPTAENWHEWRKRAKDLSYQINALRRLWPKPLKGYRRAVKQLTDFLGDDHDLAILQEELADHPDIPRREADEDVLMPLVSRRQQQLREQAHKLGRKVYAESPSDFRTRLEEYWTAAEAQLSDSP